MRLLQLLSTANFCIITRRIGCPPPSCHTKLLNPPLPLRLASYNFLSLQTHSTALAPVPFYNPLLQPFPQTFVQPFVQPILQPLSTAPFYSPPSTAPGYCRCRQLRPPQLRLGRPGPPVDTLPHWRPPGLGGPFCRERRLFFLGFEHGGSPVTRRSANGGFSELSSSIRTIH
jgi:hypothetical protein